MVNDLVVSAVYATPVLDGRQVGDGVPRTSIGFLLYAQGEQADRSGRRNVMIAHRGAELVLDQGRVAYGTTAFDEQEIEAALRGLGMPVKAPLSALAVEFFGPGGSVGAEYHADQFIRVRAPADVRGIDPFGDDFFGSRRILRTSPLVRVEPVC